MPYYVAFNHSMVKYVDNTKFFQIIKDTVIWTNSCYC